MAERGEKGRFLPGSGGRPVGARNKLHADLIAAYQKAFDGNAEAFNILAKEEPATFLKLGVALCPKEYFNGDGKGSGLSEDELNEALELLRRQRAAEPQTAREH